MKYRLIPVLPMMIGGLFLLFNHLFFNFSDSWIYGLSGLFSFLIYFSVRKISGNKLGQGDLYYGLFAALIIKPQYLWISLSFSVISAMIFGFWYKKTGKTEIPFIPFMFAGACVALICTNTTLFQFLGR